MRERGGSQYELSDQGVFLGGGKGANHFCNFDLHFCVSVIDCACGGAKDSRGVRRSRL